MKKFIILAFLISIFSVTIFYHREIVDFMINNISKSNKTATVLKNNYYASNESYKYIQLTDNFYPKNKQDIMNIYYTIINSGMNVFTFYCDPSYKTCLDNINYISNNQKMLSYINNFVPVYNSFKNIETEFDSLGKITVHITHNYTKEEVKEINARIEEIIKELNITDDMQDKEIIKLIHDYIINFARYDTDKSDKQIDKYKSDTAYGTLIQGYTICGGYADSMKLFLDYFKIPNFKISSENHIWNGVYINNNWYHVDLTWDDPVTNTGEDILEYDYFLITNKELEELENEQHIFDFEIYQELKNQK